MKYDRHCEPFAHPDPYQIITINRAKGEAIYSSIKSLSAEIATPTSADFDPRRVEFGGDGFAMAFMDRLLRGNTNSPTVLSSGSHRKGQSVIR